MPVTLTDYTLTYDSDQRIQGWPSFYSYTPDWMIGMNNYFYTFYQGELYRHNSNATRNSFYGTIYGSTVTTVFNTRPLENKLYKTVALQGVEAWDALMESDIQISNTVERAWFEQKEGVWFAFVRNQDAAPNYALRSVNGIGDGIVSGAGATTQIDFPLSVDLSTINATPVAGTNVGDMLYFGTVTPTLGGQVIGVTINLQAGDNYIIVHVTVAGGAAIPLGSNYCLYAKNAVAESHGVLGHYATTTLSHPGTTQGELFAVQSDVMRSYP